MRNSALSRALVAATMVLGLSVGMHAQGDSQKPAQPDQAQRHKPATKTRKVWTDDNLSSVRTPADKYAEAQQPRLSDVSDKQAVPAQRLVAANSGKPAAKPAPLSVAKSAEDADAKIAWEQRDIQGQYETIDRLQEQLRTAPPEQQEHLQQLIEQHKQSILDTQREMQGLQEQRANFEKKPGTANQNSSAAAQPPSE
jgi:hypothetical protein